MTIANLGDVIVDAFSADPGKLPILKTLRQRRRSLQGFELDMQRRMNQLTTASTLAETDIAAILR